VFFAENKEDDAEETKNGATRHEASTHNIKTFPVRLSNWSALQTCLTSKWPSQRSQPRKVTRIQIVFVSGVRQRFKTSLQHLTFDFHLMKLDSLLLFHPIDSVPGPDADFSNLKGKQIIIDVK